jgi:hypothetical protein
MTMKLQPTFSWLLWLRTCMLKLKLSHCTPWRHLGERKYSSYSFMTSALDGGEWSASHPGRALDPGEGPLVLIGQEAGASDLVWTKRLEEKSFCFCRRSNSDRQVVQSVVRHYADWTRTCMSPFADELCVCRCKGWWSTSNTILT